MPDHITYHGPNFRPHDGKDHRLDCWFCGAPSIATAPQYVGGDIDIPCHFIPVCIDHAADWYEDIPDDEQIPMIPRDGVFLTREQAEAAYEVLNKHLTRDDEMHVEAVHALGSGLRGLDAF